MEEDLIDLSTPLYEGKTYVDLFPHQRQMIQYCLDKESSGKCEFCFLLPRGIGSKISFAHIIKESPYKGLTIIRAYNILDSLAWEYILKQMSIKHFILEKTDMKMLFKLDNSPGLEVLLIKGLFGPDLFCREIFEKKHTRMISHDFTTTKYASRFRFCYNINTRWPSNPPKMPDYHESMLSTCSIICFETSSYFLQVMFLSASDVNNLISFRDTFVHNSTSRALFPSITEDVSQEQKQTIVHVTNRLIDDECSICLIKGQKHILLSCCNHTICEMCFKKLNNCPYCRKQMLSKKINFDIEKLYDALKEFLVLNERSKVLIIGDDDIVKKIKCSMLKTIKGSTGVFKYSRNGYKEDKSSNLYKYFRSSNKHNIFVLSSCFTIKEADYGFITDLVTIGVEYTPKTFNIVFNPVNRSVPLNVYKFDL